jgi:SAM-dependent methyltransferase
MTTQLKDEVHDFWNAESCGESYGLSDAGVDLQRQAAERYRLEPYLAPFARFEDGRGKDVLEVGVGLGADHGRWAQSEPRSLSGVDLTPRAIAFTGERLRAAAKQSDLRVADAENLPFADASFDIVYSWGVLHHSPDTRRCFAEVARVLRPGGVARILIYHKWSPVGAMLWLRYGLACGRPGRSLTDIYAEHLESPGTKAFTRAEGEALCRDAGFTSWSVRVQLSHGDLLEGNVGVRHEGALLSIAKRFWPRKTLQRFGNHIGLCLLIEARL